MLRALDRLGDAHRILRTRQSDNGQSSSSSSSRDTPPERIMSSAYFTPPPTPQRPSSRAGRKRLRSSHTATESATTGKSRTIDAKRRPTGSPTIGCDGPENSTSTPAGKSTRRSARLEGQAVPPTPPSTVTVTVSSGSGNHDPKQARPSSASEKKRKPKRAKKDNLEVILPRAVTVTPTKPSAGSTARGKKKPKAVRRVAAVTETGKAESLEKIFLIQGEPDISALVGAAPGTR